MSTNHKWRVYCELVKIKHPFTVTDYPFNGIDGAKIEHTLNELTLMYDKDSQKFQPSGKKNRFTKGGKEYSKTGTITVYY
jgi:hypothetical protein